MKKDNTTRFCVDVRELNRVILRDSYPLPNIRDILDRLGGCRYFTTLDINSAYWHVPLKEDDRSKTAFTTGAGCGIYEFKVMPFGPTNTPASFQRLIDIILGKSKNTLAYLDDIIIFSKTWSKHIKHMEETFSLIKDSGFKLSPKKCRIGLYHVNFLGYVITSEGIKMNEDRIKPILEWPVPNDQKALQRFLGRGINIV